MCRIVYTLALHIVQPILLFGKPSASVDYLVGLEQLVPLAKRGFCVCLHCRHDFTASGTIISLIYERFQVVPGIKISPEMLVVRMVKITELPFLARPQGGTAFHLQIDAWNEIHHPIG